MPLIQQESGRSGSKLNRHSLGDFIGFDSSHVPNGGTAPLNQLPNGCDTDKEWRWEQPGSPEAAQSPRALVPASCFPPAHSRAYESYSESARPGGGWDENGQGITDLVASLKALAMPSAPSRLETSIQVRLRYDQMENNGNNSEVWPEIMSSSSSTATALSSASREDSRLLRRASFCGSTASTRTWPVWSGVLPADGEAGEAGYSVKVFIGGLPYDLTEHALLEALEPFQPIGVSWPGRSASAPLPRGFAYVTMSSERAVRALLAACRRDAAADTWYLRVRGRRLRPKEAQVIPWPISSSTWVSGGSARLAPARTVFVGGLHGRLAARALAAIMDDLFGDVVYAGIDCDKDKYPIGSGRVTFGAARGFVRAVAARHVEIVTDKFTKKVQVDPYLEDSMCSVCNLQQGPYFCREPVCFMYFCRTCWSWQHPADEHRALTRAPRRSDASPASGSPQITF